MDSLTLMVNNKIFLYTMVGYARFHVMFSSSQLFKGAKSYPLDDV